MGTRNPDPRLIKIHRSYTVEEVATRLGVHRNTVREWHRQGLTPIDQRRPMLFQGRVLVAFLQSRRNRTKRPCAPGQIFCVRCREPRLPLGKRVAYKPLTEGRGNLVGACSVCHAGLYRRVSLPKLAAAVGDLEVSFPEALQHIDESH